MIQFPETAEREWRKAAAVAEAPKRMRQQIEQGVAVENAVAKLWIAHEAREIFQQQLEAADTPELVMGTLAEHLAKPNAAPTDIIEGVVREGGLCVVLGPSGAGKSTLALQMFHSMLTGADFLGQPTTPIKGRVGAISYDMPLSMMVDWVAGFPNVKQTDVSIVDAHGRGNPLAVADQRKTIVATWRRAKVDVVLIDSFSASFSGHDQNDAAQVMAHYRELKKFALTEVGAKSLIVIVHSTKSSPLQARGSTTHQDVSDTMLAVVKDDDKGTRMASMVKYRAPRGQEEMSPRILTAPDSVTHLVQADWGAMNLKGLPIPAHVVGTLAFPALPDTHEEPDTESDGDDGEY